MIWRPSQRRRARMRMSARRIGPRANNVVRLSARHAIPFPIENLERRWAAIDRAHRHHFLHRRLVIADALLLDYWGADA